MDIKSNRAALQAWLTLLRAPGLGAMTLRELVSREGDANAALVAARRGAHARIDDACRAWLRTPDMAVVEADLTWLGATGHALLAFDDADFPPLLNESPCGPAALFVAGDPSSLWRPQIAIVGSRNASQTGTANAAAFARALARSGFTITSGLAEGVDGAAHAAALDAGGTTIAVLGTGPDQVYPPRHQALSARIELDGARVSELPPGTPGRPQHFPRRNRIIAGLSLGTLVVEAGLRSGALITARNAAEAGREVFAIPGSIHNPLARGCHQLIRSGAKLVETAEEIIAELAPLALRLGADLRERLRSGAAGDIPEQAQPSREPVPRMRAPLATRSADADYARLFAALGHDALGIDQLAQRSDLSVAQLSSMLLMLELEGEVVAAGSGAYARRVGPASGV